MAAAPLDQWSDGGSDSDWDWSDEEENDSPFDAAMRDHHQFIITAVHLSLSRRNRSGIRCRSRREGRVL